MGNKILKQFTLLKYGKRENNPNIFKFSFDFKVQQSIEYYHKLAYKTFCFICFQLIFNSIN